MHDENTQNLLVPPDHYIRQSQHHWLQPLDGDGRDIHGPMVMLWQPAAKGWCYSGNFATGQRIELRKNMYRYLCVCDMPDLENNMEILSDRCFRQNVTRLHQKLVHNRPGCTLEKHEVALICELLRMHGNPI